MRAAARRSRDLFAGVELLGLLDPVTRGLRSLAERAGEVDLQALLGFDPLRVLSALLRQSETAPDDGAPDDEPDEPAHDSV